MRVKRYLPLLLAIAMMLTFMPVAVFADASIAGITEIKYSGGENGVIRDAAYSGGIKQFDFGDTLTVYVTINTVSKELTYTYTHIWREDLEEYQDRWVCNQVDAPSISAWLEDADGYESVAFGDTYNYKAAVLMYGLEDTAYSANYTARKTIMDWDNNVDHIGYSVRTWEDASTVVLYSCDSDALSSTTNITIPEKATLADDNQYTVVAINRDALGGLGNLKTITIPASVTKMEDYAVGYTVNEWRHEQGKGWVPVNPIKNTNLVIIGTKGSAAESYAKANGFTFKDIDAEAEEQARREAEQARQAAIAAAEAARQGTPGNLPKAKASKPKASKKAITVKWKKLNKKQLKKGVSKMEVWVSPNGSFANGSTIEKMVGKKKGSVKVKGLAKGTYFVKVRAITYSGGTKVVGPWSAVKSVKVKK